MSDLQRTDDWFKDRLGIPTASQFSKLITSAGKPSSQAQGYINQLIAERVTGGRQETHTSEAMQRGIDMEANALAWFELETDLEVTEHGLIRHPEVEAGCSPDGLIGYDSGLEIKCPSSHTHVKYLRAGKLPSEYVQQVQGSMWVTGRQYWWFLSYHPEMPQLLLKIERDEEYISLLAEEVSKAAMTAKTEAEKIKESMR